MGERAWVGSVTLGCPDLVWIPHFSACTQQEAAARRRGIPLVLVGSLRPKEVLLALRPLLLDKGLVPDAAAHRKVGWGLYVSCTFSQVLATLPGMRGHAPSREPECPHSLLLPAVRSRSLPCSAAQQ